MQNNFHWSFSITIKNLRMKHPPYFFPDFFIPACLNTLFKVPGGQIITRMSGNCYTTLFLRVFILSMASLLIDLEPAVLFDNSYYISDFHITSVKLSILSSRSSYYDYVVKKTLRGSM